MRRFWLILILLVLVILVVGSYIYIRTTPELPLLAHYRPLPSRVPSAFYSGGLEKGTGGQISQENYTSLFSPSPATSLTGSLMPPEAYPSPETCARCHIGIHENWQGSMHAVSATDEWYLKVKELLAFEEGKEAVRMCAGCHAPVALMTGEVGLYNRESASSQQGVSCIFCHTLESVQGHSGAWVSDPGRVRMYRGGDYLAETAIENAAHLVMASPGVHKADMSRPLYQDSAMCMGCHQFELNGVTLQSTYEEWKASSYADKGIPCQSCHFTPGAGVTYPDPGKLVEHYPATHDHILRHTLGGGSTVVTPNREQNLAILKEAVELQVNQVGQMLEITVFNRKAGHAIPTGVGDLRVMWLEIIALDENGTEVFISGKADAAGYLPQDTIQFHQVLGDEQGNPIVRHDIWRATQILEDTRIPADGLVKTSFTLSNPSVQVQVRLLWRDAPAEFEQRVLNRSGESLPVIELAMWQN